jgi:hypothetical protein
VVNLADVLRNSDMTLRKKAIIVVDQPDEVVSFYEWLSRNRAQVIGISKNEGCGCCVDMFHVELRDGAEPMPCESAGDFDKSTLRFGQERDDVITASLDYRLGNAEPDGAGNSHHAGQ